MNRPPKSRSTRPSPQPAPRHDDNPGPQPWEEGLTLDEGVSWMIAEEAGLNGRALAKAGQAAHATLRMLRAATRAPSAAQRKRLAERAKAALKEIKARDLSADARRALTEQVTAKVQELSGGAESRTPSVNPETGLQEFASPMVMRPGMPKVEMRNLPYRPGIDPKPEMRNLPYNPEIDGPAEWSLLGAQNSRGLLNPNAGTPSGGLLNSTPPSPAAPDPQTPAPPAKMPPLPERKPQFEPIWPPPRPGTKPDPNMSDAVRSELESDADRLRARISGDADSRSSNTLFPDTNLANLGLFQSAQSLQRFMSGSGRERRIDPDMMRSSALISQLEEENRERFRGRTFGEWSPTTTKGRREKAKLDALKDGESTQINDRWDQDFESFNLGTFLGSDQYLEDQDIALTIGSGKLRSDGNFDVSRAGDTLNIIGTVTHGIDDLYDFKEELGSGWNDPVSSAYRLQESGYAQPFYNRSKWTQPMKATVAILPNGKRAVREIEWGDISPYDWKVGD